MDGVSWVWAVALIAEGLVLYWGQRTLFFHLYSRSRAAAYALAMPGTALHELSHWLMCKLVGVPTGRVELFRPRKVGDSITLGQVEHGRADPLRMTLVAIAPLILVPPLLVGIGVLLFGSDLLQQPWQAVWESAWYVKVVGLYLLFSTSSAAFPSPGDHIPFTGLVLLCALGALVVALSDPQTLTRWLKLAATIAAPTAIATLIQLALWNPR